MSKWSMQTSKTSTKRDRESRNHKLTWLLIKHSCRLIIQIFPLLLRVSIMMRFSKMLSLTFRLGKLTKIRFREKMPTIKTRMIGLRGRINSFALAVWISFNPLPRTNLTKIKRDQIEIITKKLSVRIKIKKTRMKLRPTLISWTSLPECKDKYSRLFRRSNILALPLGWLQPSSIDFRKGEGKTIMRDQALTKKLLLGHVSTLISSTNLQDLIPLIRKVRINRSKGKRKLLWIKIIQSKSHL